MRYRIIVALIAAVIAPASGAAQQGTLKQQLVGTWALVSFEFTPTNSIKRQVANPKGILIFDAGGLYANVMARADRPKFKSATQPTTEELATSITDFFAANAGTWSISEADKILTQRYDLALRPPNEGQDIKTSVSLVGDRLMLTDMALEATGGKVETVYRRIK